MATKQDYREWWISRYTNERDRDHLADVHFRREPHGTYFLSAYSPKYSLASICLIESSLCVPKAGEPLRLNSSELSRTVATLRLAGLTVEVEE